MVTEKKKVRGDHIRLEITREETESRLMKRVSPAERNHFVFPRRKGVDGTRHPADRNPARIGCTHSSNHKNIYARPLPF